MSEAYKKHEDNNLISELPVPAEIVSAGATVLEGSSNKKEQQHHPGVQLFFSFDIVNSTMYKTMTGNWPLIMRSLLTEINMCVRKMDILFRSYLWRVIGDEMIFVLPVESETSIIEAVEAIFEVNQRISISLSSGKFFDTLADQRLQKSEINILKHQNTLSVKSTAWIAVVNQIPESQFDNMSFEYLANEYTRYNIREFLGQDIDAGFRLKQYTQDRRLCLSVELAYLLSQKRQKIYLNILDYVRLKGVWNEALYPVIWYHNPDIVKKCRLEMLGDGTAISFINSFRYDETDNNEIVKNYLHRSRYIKKKAKKQGVDSTEAGSFELDESMYRAKPALQKIVNDRNLSSKIEYIRQYLKEEIAIKQAAPYAYPLSLHCAVVCCDVQEKKVLIAHRGQEHDTNPGRWEFGCAKVSGSETLVNSIKEHYLKAFGVEIELVMDSSRDDIQPKPIAMYELKKSEGNIPKGIIFVAKVINKIDPAKFRSENEHDRIAWISRKEIEKYSKAEVVTDFHATLETVFQNFEDYFHQEV